MTSETDTGRDGPAPADPAKTDPFTAGEAALDRAKAVSRRITRRCEELTGQTQLHHRPLPPDTTNQPPG